MNNKIIAENDYNIAVSSYVVAEDTREVVDMSSTRKCQHRCATTKTSHAIDEIVADIEGTK